MQTLHTAQIYIIQSEPCQELEPAWEKLAADWNGHAVGLLASIDCSDPGSEVICEEFEVTSFPTLYYGDPQSPEEYNGELTYELLSLFAQDHISQPVCSVAHLEHCDAAHKELIGKLQALPKAELEAVEQDVHARVQAAQEKLDQELEVLSQQYEKSVNAFNQQVDTIRDETNFKWVQQILALADEEKHNADAAKREL